MVLISTSHLPEKKKTNHHEHAEDQDEGVVLDPARPESPE
jgi:hypothetical protein